MTWLEDVAQALKSPVRRQHERFLEAARQREDRMAAARKQAELNRLVRAMPKRQAKALAKPRGASLSRRRPKHGRQA